MEHSNHNSDVNSPSKVNSRTVIQKHNHCTPVRSTWDAEHCPAAEKEDHDKEDQDEKQNGRELFPWTMSRLFPSSLHSTFGTEIS